MTTTHDFTTQLQWHKNAGPGYAEGMHIASALDLEAIKVDVWNGPIGSCGFRSGYWNARMGDETFRFYASISHAVDLNTQERFLTLDAARHIGLVRAGYKTDGE